MFNVFLLLGETDLIKKNETDDIGLMSGTQVMEGTGRMLIVGVGLNSQVGTIMSLLGATEGSKKTKPKKKKGKNGTWIVPHVFYLIGEPIIIRTLLFLLYIKMKVQLLRAMIKNWRVLLPMMVKKKRWAIRKTHVR